MNDYVGIVAEVSKVEAIEGADRIQVGYVLGEPVIIGKDIVAGHKGIFFPPDTQLSSEFVYYNNLARDSALNEDKTKKGFFESNRRVRAQPFLGVVSCGYFAELRSVAYTGLKAEDLKVGTRIGKVGKEVVAQKYINPNIKTGDRQPKGAKRKKLDTPLFYEHDSTAQFKYHSGNIPKGSVVSIQAKKHGTSGRSSYTLVKRPAPWYKRLLGQETVDSWEYLTGTRRVVLKGERKDGFHGCEDFRYKITEQLKPHLERGVTVYYEIIGYANDKLIMGSHDVTKLKDKAFTGKYGKSISYTYGNKQGECSIVIYRVTLTTIDGATIDLTQQQLKQWCEVRGLPSTHDLVEPFVYDGGKEALEALVEQLTERPEVLTEDYQDPSHISEGVIVRVDGEGLTPKFYKSKSKAFRILEGIFKEDNVDMEDNS